MRTRNGSNCGDREKIHKVRMEFSTNHLHRESESRLGSGLKNEYLQRSDQVGKNE